MERTVIREREAQRRDRRHAGFTLAETMAVVGLLVVLMGVSFAGIVNVWRSMRQLEMDGTAKEIFVAAQNHLSMAESQGLLELEMGTGYTFARGELEPDAEADDADAIHYFMVVASSVTPATKEVASNPNYKGSVLNLMLPVGSIDDTVRLGGSYVVRYQPSSATVLDVFYTKEGNLGASDADSDHYAALMGTAYDASGKPKDDRLARRSFEAYDKAGAESKKITVGYYGGGEGHTTPIKLKAPTVNVVNAERLLVEVSNPKKNQERLGSLKLQLRVIVEGEQSGAMAAFALSDDLRVESDTFDLMDPYDHYALVLDDVTVANGSFQRNVRVGDGSAIGGDGTFVAGENLRIYAWATCEDGLATVAKSAAAKTNSLFASGKAVLDIAIASYQVEVSNMRHLLNLDPRVSGFAVSEMTCKDASTNVTYAASSVEAIQTSDLSWAGFKNKILATRASTGEPSVVYAPTGSLSETQLSTAEGMYLPVNPTYVLDYDGRAHCVKSVSVAGSKDGATGFADSAGLFGVLDQGGSRVANLELIGFDINSVGKAGAMAGEVGSGVAVSNVLARNSLTKTGDTTHTKRIAGATAGGLVGELGGTLQKSAAAVYVEGTTAAGGLVGAASGTTASIVASYAGGHTRDGQYPTLTASEASGEAHLNIVSTAASGAAGGLVGTSSGASIEGCYATCSARAGASGSVGGLVGTATGGSIKSSYAVGLVDGGASGARGAFAGSLDASALDKLGTGGEVNQYLDLVNTPVRDTTDSTSGVVPAIGSAASSTAIQAADDDVAGFATFFPSSGGKAIPYDLFLARRHGGTYPMRTIAQQMDETAVDTAGETPVLTVHLRRHYGDWPVVETLFVNTKT